MGEFGGSNSHGWLKVKARAGLLYETAKNHARVLISSFDSLSKDVEGGSQSFMVHSRVIDWESLVD